MLHVLKAIRKRTPKWIIPGNFMSIQSTNWIVRNVYYFLAAFYIFVYSLTWIVYWRDEPCKIWYLFRANDFWEGVFLSVTALVFAIDTIPVFLAADLPGRTDVYIHHAMIIGMAIWCVIQGNEDILQKYWRGTTGEGFPFVMFGKSFRFLHCLTWRTAGLQEASNLTYLAKVYFKSTIKMRFITQLIHMSVFAFFRFVVQFSFLVVALAVLKVPVCYQPICIGMDLAFVIVLLLSIRWFYFVSDVHNDSSDEYKRIGRSSGTYGRNFTFLNTSLLTTKKKLNKGLLKSETTAIMLQWLCFYS